MVSTTFRRLKREWNEEKARKELRQLITDRGSRNVSQVSKFGYKDVWVGSQSYRYNPDKPLSKPLIKAMFDQTYVSYNVEMTKGQRKRHRDRQSKLEYTKESAKQYEVFKSTKKALQVFKELKPAEIGRAELPEEQHGLNHVQQHQRQQPQGAQSDPQSAGCGDPQ